METFEELKDMPYNEYLETQHWKNLRLKKLKQAYFRCQLCNDGESNLHIHHRTYVRKGNERDNDLIVLCKNCHKLFHDNVSLKGESENKTVSQEQESKNIERFILVPYSLLFNKELKSIDKYTYMVLYSLRNNKTKISIIKMDTIQQKEKYRVSKGSFNNAIKTLSEHNFISCIKNFNDKGQRATNNYIIKENKLNKCIKINYDIIFNENLTSNEIVFLIQLLAKYENINAINNINKSVLAEELNITRATLYNHIKTLKELKLIN